MVYLAIFLFRSSGNFSNGATKKIEKGKMHSWSYTKGETRHECDNEESNMKFELTHGAELRHLYVEKPLCDWLQHRSGPAIEPVESATIPAAFVESYVAYFEHIYPVNWQEEQSYKVSVISEYGDLKMMSLKV